MEYAAPEDAAKLIFRKMRGGGFGRRANTQNKSGRVCELREAVWAETAQSALGSNVTEAVVAVPFEFAPAQKKALR